MNDLQHQQYSVPRLSLPPLQTAQKPLLSPHVNSWCELPPMQSSPSMRSRLPTCHAERGRSFCHRRQNSSSSRSASPPSPRLSQHGGRARAPRTDRNVLDEPLPPHISDLIARIQPTPRTGPWDEAEDQVLLYFVDGGRNKNWVRIAARMHFRTAKQCRERYFQSLRPGISHAACTPEEAALILRLVDQIGTRWADIARRLGNRSDNWVKNWWNGQRNERSKNRNAAAAATKTSPKASAASPAQPRQHQHYGESAPTEGLYAPYIPAQQTQHEQPQPAYSYGGYDRNYDRRPSFVPSYASDMSPHQSSRMSEAGSPSSLDWSSAASASSASSLSLAATPAGFHSPRSTGAATYTQPSYQHYSLPPASEIVQSLDELERRKAAAAAGRYQPSLATTPEKSGTRMSLAAVLN